MSLKRTPDGAAFVCTDEDMSYGGGPLPRDPRANHSATDEEKEELVKLFRAYQALKKLGWNESMYAPRDGTPFLAIEPGSTGVHEAVRDEHGFWIYDGDMWPSHPLLWRPMR